MKAKIVLPGCGVLYLEVLCLKVYACLREEASEIKSIMLVLIRSAESIRIGLLTSITALCFANNNLHLDLCTSFTLKNLKELDFFKLFKEVNSELKKPLGWEVKRL